MRRQALEYLRTALKKPSASFRDGQWESIEQLLIGKRVLVVQRTGWGKSMVYFLATKLLRERGEGPTLLISPLLSLMRNQIESAQRIGVKALTLNSTNTDEWEVIQDELLANRVDILLISPERLANDSFRQNILSNLVKNIGLFAIDEAHCISDWGHDFRPDYRRIERVLHAIPSTVSIVATTATANNRVVTDVKGQLGQNIIVQRGSLIRNSLKLQNISMPKQVARLAWLAQTIPTLPGSGIVYTLTQHDAERVTEWLRNNHIDAAAYHADVAGREQLEWQLLNNEIKVLVATVALGMGFDKPDLEFIIHYQRPASVVHYYQQVGRAGRAVDQAYGILLCGTEDDHIADYFIRQAFPPQQHVTEILKALDESDNGLSVPELQVALNLANGHIAKTLKFLTVESPSPVVKIGTKWHVTADAATYRMDEERMNVITKIRYAEQRQMRDYMRHSRCLMNFLRASLDDPSTISCGQCRNCNPALLLDETYDERLANEAAAFLHRSRQPIQPRKQWPVRDLFKQYALGPQRRIDETLQHREGLVLTIWREAGWGELVAHGKLITHQFDDKLVTACVRMLRNVNFVARWVTAVPSLERPDLVPDFAERLASALHLPFIPCVEKVVANRRQIEMENSYQQARNLDGVYRVLHCCQPEACLLVDDVIMSGWTFTVVAALLLQAGCSAVFPLALASNKMRIN